MEKKVNRPDLKLDSNFFFLECVRLMEEERLMHKL